MRKKIAIIAAVLIAAVLLTSSIVNNISAKKVAEELEQLPIPKQTEYIESVSRAGKLTGNGNGMQYFGAILIKSELTREELDEHYAEYRENEWECQVADQDTREIVFIDHVNMRFKSDITEDENYYIVYSWGNGIKPFSELDIRGH